MDPSTALAFSMNASPGVYALLLGSGISRSAQIPTGWEVMQDLIKKIALLEEDGVVIEDAEKWFASKYGQPPTYSRLLEMVASTPAERSTILKGYFEPQDDEEGSQVKQPTVAHKSIARLVKMGAVRVILTTNFDKLLEHALYAEGITPTIISSTDSIQGAMPVTHSQCTLIKIHGDYLDLRTKNTPSELEAYDPEMDHLLDRIFDEFGLVICGWSGDNDPALCRALLRQRNRRFATYWGLKGDASEKAKELISHRLAHPIQIRDADQLFSSLADKVEALKDMPSQHPLSVSLAVAQVKKYLAEDRYKIKLHDLIMQETETIISQITGPDYPVTYNPGEFVGTHVADRVYKIESLCEVLMAMLATIGYWGNASHIDICIKAITRLGDVPWSGNGIADALRLRIYPAVLAQYAAGIGSVCNKKYKSTVSIISNPEIRGHAYTKYLPLVAFDELVSRNNVFNSILDYSRKNFPMSECLERALKGSMHHIVPNEDKYILAFDMYETLQSMDCAHRHDTVLPCKFLVRYYRLTNNNLIPRKDGSPLLEIDNSILRLGRNSPFIAAGFLDGSSTPFSKIKNKMDELSKKLH
jgi:hypothetical protein